MGRILYNGPLGSVGKTFLPQRSDKYRKTRWRESRRFFILHLSNSTIDRAIIGLNEPFVKLIMTKKTAKFSNISLLEILNMSRHETWYVSLRDVVCLATRQGMSRHETGYVSPRDRGWLATRHKQKEVTSKNQTRRIEQNESTTGARALLLPSFSVTLFFCLSQKQLPP